MARQNTPNTCAPLDWALFNQAEAHVPLPPRAPAVVENDTAPTSEELRQALSCEADPIALAHFTAAVERAAADLDGQGARSERIALQLLTALARFEAR